MIWLIAGYLWMTIHQAYNVWTWMGTLRVERIYAVAMLVAWIASSEKTFIENKVNLAVGLMVFSMTISAVLSPYQSVMDNRIYYDWMKWALIYLLIMTLVKSERNLKILLVTAVISFFLYIAHSYWEFLHGSGIFRQSVWRLIGIDRMDPNFLGTSCCYMLPFLYPFMSLLKKKWHYLFIPVYVLLSLRVVQLTGSRTSFATFILLASLVTVLSKHRLMYFVVLLLGAAITWGVMDEQYKNRFRTIWDPTVNARTTQTYASGRLSGFYHGMEAFKTSPIYGVGPGCYQLSPISTYGGARGGFQTHFLYSQIASELGILGIGAWTSLLCCVGFNHLQIRQLYKDFKQRNCEQEGQFVMRLSNSVMISCVLMLFVGFGLHNGFLSNWLWFPAFQGVGLYVLQTKMSAIRKAEWLPDPLKAGIAA